jgi:hypothetical protein
MLLEVGFMKAKELKPSGVKLSDVEFIWGYVLGDESGVNACS